MSERKKHPATIWEVSDDLWARIEPLINELDSPKETGRPRADACHPCRRHDRQLRPTLGTRPKLTNRVKCTLKEEEVDLSEYIDYHDAYRQLGRFLDDVYMHKRIHSSLGYLTPAEFGVQWRKEQALALELN